MSASPSVPVRPAVDSAATLFADSWSIYVRILEHNYMFHREIYRNLGEYLQAYFSARPFRVLDLGCGNAQFFAEALTGLPVSGYTGYDLSAAALEEAARNLAALAVPTALQQGDLLAALRQEYDAFDLIFTSFAVHHLCAEDKAEFFRRAALGCRAGGVLVMIDVMRDEEQDRDTSIWMPTQASWRRRGPPCREMRWPGSRATYARTISLNRERGSGRWRQRRALAKPSIFPRIRFIEPWSGPSPLRAVTVKTSRRPDKAQRAASGKRTVPFALPADHRMRCAYQAYPFSWPGVPLAACPVRPAT